MDMVFEFILFLLVGGLPYFYFVEHKFNQLMFTITFVLFALGMYFIISKSIDFNVYFIITGVFSAIYTAYKASQTKNLYKLSYLLVFVNAPVFLALNSDFIVWYAMSLAVSSIGLFFTGKFFEKSYGSANYNGIQSLVIKTPKIAFVLRAYLINLALFPPLPSSIFILVALAHTQLDAKTVIAFATVFIANLFVGMRVLTQVLFGEENKKIHYIDLDSKDLAIHIGLMLVIIALGVFALMGALL